MVLNTLVKEHFTHLLGEHLCKVCKADFVGDKDAIVIKSVTGTLELNTISPLGCNILHVKCFNCLFSINCKAAQKVPVYLNFNTDTVFSFMWLKYKIL